MGLRKFRTVKKKKQYTNLSVIMSNLNNDRDFSTITNRRISIIEKK